MRILSFGGPSFGIVAALSAALIATQAQAQEYQVRSGDTLMGIARNQLGSAARWRELCEINRDRLEDCNLILTGMMLRLGPVQEVESPPAAQAAPAAEEPPAAQVVAEPAAPPGAANMLPNDSSRGARVGALGDGGSLPFHWNLFFGSGAAGSASVVDVTPDWIDLRITQTGEQGTVFVQFARSGSFVETTPGQGWQLTADLAVIEQDGTGNWQANLAGSQRRGDDSSLGAFVFAGDLPLGPELATFSGTAETNSPDAALVNPDLRIVSSGPWTATFRIGVPSFMHRPD